MQKTIKNWLKSMPWLVRTVRTIKNPTNIFSPNYGNIDEAELAVYNAIKNDIKIIFDVGARLNTDYINNSEGDNTKTFYLFEPNPNFYKKLCKRIKAITTSGRVMPRVVVTNCGLGEKKRHT
jgi:hypothetical protein